MKLVFTSPPLPPVSLLWGPPLLLSVTPYSHPEIRALAARWALLDVSEQAHHPDPVSWSTSSSWGHCQGAARARRLQKERQGRSSGWSWKLQGKHLVSSAHPYRTSWCSMAATACTKFLQKFKRQAPHPHKVAIYWFFKLKIYSYTFPLWIMLHIKFSKILSESLCSLTNTDVCTCKQIKETEDLNYISTMHGIRCMWDLGEYTEIIAYYWLQVLPPGHNRPLTTPCCQEQQEYGSSRGVWAKSRGWPQPRQSKVHPGEAFISTQERSARTSRGPHVVTGNYRLHFYCVSILADAGRPIEPDIRERNARNPKQCSRKHNKTNQNATCHSLLLWQGTNPHARCRPSRGCHRLPGEQLGMTATSPAHCPQAAPTAPIKRVLGTQPTPPANAGLPAARPGQEDKDRPGGEGEARWTRPGRWRRPCRAPGASPAPTTSLPVNSCPSCSRVGCPWHVWPTPSHTAPRTGRWGHGGWAEPYF